MDLTRANVHAGVAQWLERTTASQRRAAIREEVRRLDLRDHHIGGVFVPLSCLPFTLSAGEFQRIKRRSERLIAAMIQLERSAMADPHGPLRTRLWNSLSPGGQHLVEQAGFESDFSLARRLRRLDGFRTGGAGFQVIEVNQAAPLAASFHDNAHRLSSALLQRMGLDWQPTLLVPLIVEWLVAEYQHRHGSDRLPHRIAIPIEHGYPPKFSDLPAVAAAAHQFARHRWDDTIEFTVCLPWELSGQGRHLRLHGKTYDMIWRNTVYLSAYRTGGPDVSEYERICRDPGRHLIVNSARSWWTRSKEALAVIWDDAHSGGLNLTASELDDLRAGIPETRNLKYQPEHLHAVLCQRQDWVSKPTDSGFGQAVEFGANHTDTSWRHLVRSRSTDGYVFQRAVTPHPFTLTHLDLTGQPTDVVLDADLCPYHVNGAVEGPILMRALHTQAPPDTTAARRQMNLTQGGTLLPVLVTTDSA
jgi:hypothetical protein